MTCEDAAAKLNGNEYASEGSRELWAEMKANGLVAVFGASDDNMEFRGAIDDEISAYEGTTAYLTPTGLLENECENDECPHFIKLQQKSAQIEAKWDSGVFSWQYETKIPHVKFVINEDGLPYCEGIVFSLHAIPSPESRP